MPWDERTLSDGTKVPFWRMSLLKHERYSTKVGHISIEWSDQFTPDEIDDVIAWMGQVCDKMRRHVGVAPEQPDADAEIALPVSECTAVETAAPPRAAAGANGESDA